MIAAHINGQNAAENAGIQSHGGEKGPCNGAQQGRQHRGQADDASHGQTHGTQHPEAVFKFFAVAEPVAQHPVCAAQQRAEGDDVHDDLIDGQEYHPKTGDFLYCTTKPEKREALGEINFT